MTLEGAILRVEARHGPWKWYISGFESSSQIHHPKSSHPQPALHTNHHKQPPTMHVSSLLTLALAPLSLAVGINSFNDPECKGFEEHYNLNANSKGNLASTRRSFYITQEQAGCHMKFYTGLNQAPNDASTMSFGTENRDWCFWMPDGRQFRSFGFYCP